MSKHRASTHGQNESSFTYNRMENGIPRTGMLRYDIIYTMQCTILCYATPLPLPSRKVFNEILLKLGENISKMFRVPYNGYARTHAKKNIYNEIFMKWIPFFSIPALLLAHHSKGDGAEMEDCTNGYLINCKLIYWHFWIQMEQNSFSVFVLQIIWEIPSSMHWFH